VPSTTFLKKFDALPRAEVNAISRTEGHYNLAG